MTTSRPWGGYTTLHRDAAFLVKRIEVRPGCRLSLQSHEHRSEFWTVIEGHGVVTVGADEIPVGPKTAVYIPKQAKHRMHNTGECALVFVEVQVGDRLEETDIVRYEDDFGRSAS